MMTEREALRNLEVMADGFSGNDIRKALEDLALARSRPPEGLPEAPLGEKWVRIEVNAQTSLQSPDRVIGLTGEAMYVYGSPFWHGFALGQGYVWRIVDDPDYSPDTVEGLLEEALVALTEECIYGGLRRRIEVVLAKSQGESN